MKDYKQIIANKINAPLEKAEIVSLITETADDAFGDYAFPCFRLAKIMRMSPVAIAEKLAGEIEPDEDVVKVEALNGYLNFFVNRIELINDAIYGVLNAGERYGDDTVGNGKTICIDYSSVNICKSFHIGHLSTTAIGSSLYKVFTALGYNVVGINHLGDYGTQFGKMIVAYKLWGDYDTVREKGVAELQRLYVKFHQEEAAHPELTDQAREWFVKVEQGDAEAKQLFEMFKEITLNDVKEIYDRLNVKFAEIVDLSDYNMPPFLLIKSDGSSLYATRDLAAAIWRKQEYDFDKCLYVVAYQQNLHFKQLFKVLELAELPWAKDMVHVARGRRNVYA